MSTGQVESSASPDGWRSVNDGLEIELCKVFEDWEHDLGILWNRLVCDDIKACVEEALFYDIGEVKKMVVMLELGFKANLTVCGALL
jgi:hypothetical protein